MGNMGEEPQRDVDDQVWDTEQKAQLRDKLVRSQPLSPVNEKLISTIQNNESECRFKVLIEKIDWFAGHN